MSNTRCEFYLAKGTPREQSKMMIALYKPDGCSFGGRVLSELYSQEEDFNAGRLRHFVQHICRYWVALPYPDDHHCGLPWLAPYLDWLAEHTTASWSVHIECQVSGSRDWAEFDWPDRPFVISFDHDQDAMFFKLRFG